MQSLGYLSTPSECLSVKGFYVCVCVWASKEARRGRLIPPRSWSCRWLRAVQCKYWVLLENWSSLLTEPSPVPAVLNLMLVVSVRAFVRAPSVSINSIQHCKCSGGAGIQAVLVALLCMVVHVHHWCPAACTLPNPFLQLHVLFGGLFSCSLVDFIQTVLCCDSVLWECDRARPQRSTNLQTWKVVKRDYTLHLIFPACGNSLV